MSGTEINLHSGDEFNATLTYNGTNLALTLTDAITLTTWSQSFTIDIPGIVGGYTAYVGFTGSTGGLTSSQKILSWTYLAGPPIPSYPIGFSAAGLTVNGVTALSGTRLRLTNGGLSEAGSAFYDTEVNVQQFVTSFNFQLTNPSSEGFTFTIQGGSPAALGQDSWGLGYKSIPGSVAVKFDLFSNSGEGSDSTGLYTNGASPTIPAISLTPTGINLHSGHVFHAVLTYNGTTLTVLITDTATNATATQTYTVNIPAIVGGPTAYVGFTGSTGTSSSVQDILNWTYLLGPPLPSYAEGFAPGGLTLNSASYNGTRLRLTDTTHSGEQRSAFFTTPVNVQQFSTRFDFQLTNPVADGFTFTIQGGGPTAKGGGGENLGYGGIPESVAVKFDLFSNAGEGADSTGLYTDGATPTTPAIDLSSTGINLHSGDTFNAQLAYNGTVLTVVITDKVTNTSATQAYTVNIPAIVGGPTAYVGFTGGTGATTAVQEILNWSYSVGAP